MKFRSISWQIVCLSIVFIASLEARADCLLTIRQRNGTRTCLSSTCFEVRDPIILAFNSCHLQFLKLSFTNQETLLDFIDNQAQSNSSLEELFQEDTEEDNILEIKMDFYSSTTNDNFLSLDMLSYLGGENENIQVLKLTIERWLQVEPNTIKFIEETILFQQPFREIHLTFFCHANAAVVYWILYQEKDLQEQSPCSTQIEIRTQKDFNQQLEPWQINTHFQPSNEQQNKYRTPMIIILIIVILSAIVFGFYYFLYIRRADKHPKSYIDNNDIETPTSEVDPSDMG